MAWHLRAEPRPVAPAHARRRRPAGGVPGVPRAPRDPRTRPRRSWGAGASASIDIVIRPDLQPHMDNFVEGVWATLPVHAPRRSRSSRGARRLHLVLVEGAIRELDRLARRGAHRGARGQRRLPRVPPLHAWSASRRRCGRSTSASSAGRARSTTRSWPGCARVAHDLGRLVVVTLGSRGVRVFDGRPGGEDRFVPVVPVEVAGTTVGCGDAFVAAFLAAWRRVADVLAAVEAGKARARRRRPGGGRSPTRRTAPRRPRRCGRRTRRRPRGADGPRREARVAADATRPAVIRAHRRCAAAGAAAGSGLHEPGASLRVGSNAAPATRSARSCLRVTPARIETRRPSARDSVPGTADRSPSARAGRDTRLHGRRRIADVERPAAAWSAAMLDPVRPNAARRDPTGRRTPRSPARTRRSRSPPPTCAWRRSIAIATDAPVLLSGRAPPRHAS